MQIQSSKVLANSRRIVATALVLFTCLVAHGQNFQPSIVGTWEGLIYSNASVTNASMLQCVFTPQGEYTCILSKAGLGAFRHWGTYRIIGNELEIEIRGHQPENIVMPGSDHAEIVSLTADYLITKAFGGGIYVVSQLRRVQ